MEEKVAQLNAVATPGELAEIDVLQRAVTETLEEYQADFTAARRKNWEDAKQGLEAAVNRIYEKYFPHEEMFPHLMAALAYLQEEGWKVSKSKLYKDAADGLLQTADGNRVRESALMAYAYENLKPSDDGKQDAELRPLVQEEKRLDISIKRRKDAQIAWEMEKEMGKWLPKKDLGLEFAARAGWMDAQLESVIRAKAAAWIQLVGGNQKKEQLLVDAMLAEKDLVMNDYATMDMAHVLFKKKKG